MRITRIERELLPPHWQWSNIDILSLLGRQIDKNSYCPPYIALRLGFSGLLCEERLFTFAPCLFIFFL